MTRQELNRFVDRRLLRFIFWLALVCLLLTLGLRGYIQLQLQNYEAAQTVVSQEGQQEEAGSLAAMQQILEPEEALQENQQEYFSRQLSEMDEQAEAILNWSYENGSSQKQIYETIAELWNTQMRALASGITEAMTEDESRLFWEEQSEFIKSRNAEAMKVIGSTKDGASESIDYQKKMAELTRERCFALLKDYESYLDY